MPLCRRIVPTLALLLCLFGSVRAQLPHVVADSASTRPGSLGLSFERNVNTFTWDLTGDWRLARDAWSASVTERFRRSLIRSDNHSIKDQHDFSAEAAWAASDKLRLLTSLNSFIFLDDRGLGLNDLSKTQFLAGPRWSPLANSEFTPMIGYVVDNQQGMADEGLLYSARAQWQGRLFGDTRGNANAQLMAEHITPRYQKEQLATVDVLAPLASGSSNSSSVMYRDSQREFYVAGDASLATTGSVPIERRRERVFGVQNALLYRIAEPLHVLAAVDAAQRLVHRGRSDRASNSEDPLFDLAVNEFTLNGSAQLMYEDERRRISLKIELNERDETYDAESFEGANSALFLRRQQLEEQKDNTIRQTQLTLGLSHAIGEVDTLGITASTVKIEYDTPSRLNFDDRDELFVLAGLRWAHRFSSDFQASIMSDLTMRHTVFLFSQRSANNTWNRVLRLLTTSDYRKAQRFSSRNTAEVVANYTVYDFELPTQGRQSFSLRQLTLSDSSAIRIGGPFWIDAVAHARWYERGELRWSAFTVRPLQDFAEYTISVSLQRIGTLWSIAAGFRYFEQRRHSYNGSARSFSGSIASYGPTASARLSLSPRTRVLLDGWYQRTQEYKREGRDTPNVIMSVQWFF